MWEIVYSAPPAECVRLDALDGPCSGLKWLEFPGNDSPTGTELTNEALSEALQTKLDSHSPLEFTKEEWDAFGIKKLMSSHFINARAQGDAMYWPYFLPVNTLEERLQAVLVTQTVFTHAEWTSIFGLPRDKLLDIHYVPHPTLADTYFRPAGVAPRVRCLRLCDEKAGWACVRKAWNQPAMYRLLTWAALILYPPICRKSLTIFDCVPAGIDEVTGQLIMVLRDDPTLPEGRCQTAWWTGWAVFASVGIAVYCLGIPVVSLYLARHRGRLCEGQASEKCVRHVGR